MIVNLEDFFLIIIDFYSGRKSAPRLPKGISESLTGGVQATRLIDTGFLLFATIERERPFGD